MAKQKKMAVRANSHLGDPPPDTADGDDAQSNSTDDDSECCWGFLDSIKESLSCGRAFYFDPRGDLILSVGEPENEVEDFVVCSRTVARGSKVFNTMLFGGFAESTASAAASDGSWTVKLPDDHTAPFFVILSILHGNYELVPRTLEEKELYEVLVVTEKYDMTHILRPWAQRWFRRLTVNGSPQFEDKQRLMWIAWELGHEGMFCKIAQDLMLSSCIDNAGQLLDGDGVPLSSNPCHEPPGILGK
ncbi:hypothetical protein C8034_v002968 [Colletotrichum sidae]|uniref:BTB domain-containing protein n=1 Tax=Colletotrichum sidae TaxID=1347389 RepID=A0A4R8PTZ1_9PEZI|nr:hypothetical protein C8034_v002968 [Colletotrichum sidae]